MKKGIDVSGFQGTINWIKLKNNHSIDFAILKLGNIYDNQPNYLDSKFEYNYQKCILLNIPVGIYIYNYCNDMNNLSKGIDWVLNVLQNRSLQLPIFLDMEDSTLICEGKSKLTSLCLKFASIILSSTNYLPGIYANLYWLNNYINTNKLNNCKIWVAQYNSTCQYKKSYMLWQYSSSGKIDGINGKVDMNYLMEDISSNTIHCNNIKQWQQIMNSTYKCNLKIDGLFGNKSKSAALNHCLYYKLPIIKNNHVLFIQNLFNNLNYHLKEDSMFGPDCRTTTLNFQKKHHLKPDGYVGPEVTLKLLQLNLH